LPRARGYAEKLMGVLNRQIPVACRSFAHLHFHRRTNESPSYLLFVSAGLLASAGNAARLGGSGKKHNCLACHAVDKKLVGPSTRCRRKYKSDAGAEAKLVAKVKNGGTGVWARSDAADASCRMGIRHW